MQEYCKCLLKNPGQAYQRSIQIWYIQYRTRVVHPANFPTRAILLATMGSLQELHTDSDFLVISFSQKMVLHPTSKLKNATAGKKIVCERALTITLIRLISRVVKGTSALD